MSTHLDQVIADGAAFDPGKLNDEVDPFPILAALRRHGPVVVTRGGMVCITGYAESDAVLRDKRFASAPIGMRYQSLLPPGAARDELANRINFLDPPDHPRIRRIVSKVFTPMAVRALQPWIERLATQLLDAAEPDGDVIDLRAALAHPLPSLAISELLGVPTADRDTLTEWTEAVTPLLGVNISEPEKARALEASDAFASYVRRLLAERRRVPCEDLLTTLVHAHDEGDRLSEPELMSLIVTLYSAGHRTTRDLLSNGLYLLLQDPDSYRALASGEASIEIAVEELLRVATPTLFVARVPTEAVEIGGVSLRAYMPAMILLAAANRDPSTFSAPDRLDIRRTEAPPLSFASGPHVCLGATLARIETAVMLGAVTRRWPTLELALPGPAHWTSGPFRGLTHLRVRPR